METKIEQHCFRCSCGKTCGEASEFEKILELRDAGLVIYKTGTDTGIIDVIILHNIKNVEIPSRDIQKSLDLCKNSCPRCIPIFERAKRIVKNMSVLDKRETMGICKNCGIKAQTYMSQLSHCKCEETVEKFLRSAAKDNDYNIKPKIKMWLDKSKQFLQSFNVNENEDNRLMTRTHSKYHLKKKYEDLTKHWSDYIKSHVTKQVSVKSFSRSKTEEEKNDFSQYFNSAQDSMVQGPQRQNTIASKSLSSPSSQAFDENFCKTLAHTKENKNKKTFQNIFPKDKDEKAKITRPISSSTFIIDLEVQGKIKESEKKVQLEEQDIKTKVTSITDKPSHEIKNKEFQDKIRDSEKKVQLKGQDKKTKVTSITDKPSHEMKNKEVQDKIRDSEKKTQLDGQGRKTKVTSITDKPSHEMKNKEVQDKIRDSEKKTQLDGQGRKTKVTNITDKPSQEMKNNKEIQGKIRNNEKKAQLEGQSRKTKVTSITDKPSDESIVRKQSQSKKEQHSEKLEQKDLKADNKTGKQKNIKSKESLKITEREKDKSNLEEPNADKLKSKIKGKTKENDKKTKPQDLNKSKSLEDQTQEKTESIKTESVAKKKSEKSTSKEKTDFNDNVMIKFLIKQKKEDDELLKKKRKEAIADEKVRLLAEKKLQQVLNQPVHKSKVFQCHQSAIFEENGESVGESLGESIVDSEIQIINSDVIVGQKIVKDKLLITKSISATMPEQISKTLHPLSVSAAKLESVSAQNQSMLQDRDKGILRYALSNKKFIDMGWTQLPTVKVVRKMNVYRMHPSHPEFDWFAHNKEKGEMLYSSGEKLAEFTEDGHGRWFYRSGKLALDYYNAQELNAQQRYVVYSTGEPDERGRSRPRTILATFDYLGNGVVFDHTGKIRLKYNQSEGVVLDRAIGPVSHWKWHTLNDPPVIQRVMFDTEMIHKDPRILNIIPEAVDDNDEKEQSSHDDMLSIELNNFVKEKSNKITQTFKPFQIKIKALKINENFSLRIVDQETVYLLFRDGTTNLKMNIGMTLDHKEILDTIAFDIGEVSISLDEHPPRSASIAALQSAVKAAQRAERTRVRTERPAPAPRRPDRRR